MIYRHSCNSDRIAETRIPYLVPNRWDDSLSLAGKTAFLLSRPPAEVADLPIALNLAGAANNFAKHALSSREAEALLDLNQALYLLYEARLANPSSTQALHSSQPWFMLLLHAIEEPWLEAELAGIRYLLPTAEVSTHSELLCDWFRATSANWNSADNIIAKFLAERATRDDFNEFILWDAHLNFRFYDALVLASLHYSEAVKHEISRHVWDEAGNGDLSAAHTAQYQRLLQKVNMGEPLIPTWADWRPYAGFNLYFALGFNRKHYFKSVGSLAMPELFDPLRDEAVVRGLDRLGYDPRGEFEYFFNHMELDAEHGERWLTRVITPIVHSQPEAGIEMAMGAALRMQAMHRYNEFIGDFFDLFQQPHVAVTAAGR